ncbi:putative transferase CAF17 homolog, mitochondrial [Condylostylus longicornis]|uniref:putative transferase CAF17 homolog, mitochondrial n=1 Tax=Condylostylus longicornis TaxID=2530218 RepID=UPI00244E21BD|nr:putative transferase CAF17 homolog, mitochondrial [Condylostylus longicornis]
MSFLRSICRKFSTLNGSCFLEKLHHRDIIRVSGNEAKQFLQGLTTNDMNHFERGSKSIYSMFLNKNGRVMYDSIIFKAADPDTFLIECDKDISPDLNRYLRLFRVRRKINIDSIENDFSTWVLYDKEKNFESLEIPKEMKDILISIDPRLKALGCRLIVPSSFEPHQLENIFLNQLKLVCSIDGENDYKLHRYKLGIGEGVIDHPPMKCFPLETNCDYLHGVSFHKGCYVGQELTARTYHTGTIRKRIMPVISLNDFSDSAGHIQLSNGTNVGTIRGIKGKVALALIRMEQALKAPELLVNNTLVEVIKPEWWPQSQNS